MYQRSMHFSQSSGERNAENITPFFLIMLSVWQVGAVKNWKQSSKFGADQQARYIQYLI